MRGLQEPACWRYPLCSASEPPWRRSRQQAGSYSPAISTAPHHFNSAETLSATSFGTHACHTSGCAFMNASAA
ncbi:hypothetical protein PS704_00461 [Pseudomonas fluorescens]|uniref:Uncharacterized protein n=1 Tax=Pseudomonas fluorescens TaxID=294 RepID=A0A5E7A694_PSEFL|nr:hypothetical protein PS704_00461 [Pseudomonas fluorescens]